MSIIVSATIPRNGAKIKFLLEVEGVSPVKTRWKGKSKDRESFFTGTFIYFLEDEKETRRTPCNMYTYSSPFAIFKIPQFPLSTRPSLLHIRIIPAHSFTVIHKGDFCEAEIIEGFIAALGAREKDGGGESPSAEECRPDFVRDCPFIHSSGEPSSQEVPPIDASPKWDGTPTQPGVEVLVPPEPLATAEGTSSPPDDDEVPIHLVFKRKTRPATRPTVQRSVETSGGPTTRGTVKKSLDQILEESR
ncbi:hypothetical protein HAX54_017030 [Datura stramonium]|uniref:Uncharacterized protein n=1 Tax=Datura stramonium TaxID=4076 RepID=A0ABS8S064_DATST|nr:hypothetical protein [Datura stramonium]